jgi:hypothetical protein
MSGYEVDSVDGEPLRDRVGEIDREVAQQPICRPATARWAGWRGLAAMARLSRLRSPSAVLFACLLASQSGMLVLSPILVDVAREFGVSTATAGQLRSISGATGGVTALVVAMAARRPGPRDLLSLGAALLVLASGLSAVAPSFTVLAAAQAVLGVGIGLLVAVGIAAAGEWPACSRIREHSCSRATRSPRPSPRSASA